MPEIGPNDVLIKVKKTGDLRHRRPHLQLGPVGAEDHPGADGGRPRIRRRGRRVRRRGHRISRSASASRAKATSSAAIAATAAPAAGISAATRSASASTGRAPSPNICRFPQHNVVPIPDDVRDEIAAIFDPLGNAVHTALSFDLVGEDVLVTGAGPIGIMGALVAQCVGARKVVITDINPIPARRSPRSSASITSSTPRRKSCATS